MTEKYVCMSCRRTNDGTPIAPEDMPVLSEGTYQFHATCRRYVQSKMDEATAKERDRIIALLEAEIDMKVWDAQMMTIAWCIALIKGEEK